MENSEEKFVLDNVFEDREGKKTEFKVLKAKNIPCTAAEYVTAYINARLQGIIYFGIEDGSRKVVGIKMNEKERDQITRRIPETILQITPLESDDPKVVPDWFDSDHFPVMNSDGLILEDTYIVRVVIKAIENPGLLYKVSPGKSSKVYHKGDGSKLDIDTLHSKQVLKERKIERAKEDIKKLQKHCLLQEKPEKLDISKWLYLACGIGSNEDIVLADQMISKYYFGDTDLLIKKADAYRRIGNLNSALSSLKEVQDGSDSSNEDKRREASLKRGEIYREMHNTEDAIKEYDDVLARHSDDYVTLYLKSLIYMEESKYKLAISLLKSSLKVNPRYRVAKYALRECYGKLYFKRDKQQKK